jgi:hypothetical protein
VSLLVSSNNVTKRSGTEEVLLLQTQLFALITRVVRIKHTCNILCRLALTDCSEVVTFVELIEVKFVVRT